MTGIAFRPVGPGDEPLLFRLYASTREAELAQVPWTHAQRLAFLQMQFTAQQQHYRSYFPAAAHDLILYHGQAVGRLYVDRTQGEIRIMDITILPERRGKGIGTAVIHGLLAEAAGGGRPVRIHVESFNRSRGLFERLGFRPVAETGVHLLFEWRSEGPARKGE